MKSIEKRSFRSWLNRTMTRDELFNLVRSYMISKIPYLRSYFKKELNEMGVDRLTSLSHEQLKTYWEIIKPKK